ncbi:hypothetical protein ACFSKM_14230 [Ancylobacter dichloromethanicus]
MPPCGPFQFAAVESGALRHRIEGERKVDVVEDEGGTSFWYGPPPAKLARADVVCRLHFSGTVRRHADHAGQIHGKRAGLGAD